MLWLKRTIRFAIKKRCPRVSSPILGHSLWRFHLANLFPKSGRRWQFPLPVTLINAFRSELFNMLYHSAQNGEELHVGDETPDSRKELAKALGGIDGAELKGYRPTWDAENGAPGNWLGVDISDGDGLVGSSAALPAQGSSAAAQAIHVTC